jgi:hypothetical protein
MHTERQHLVNHVRAAAAYLTRAYSVRIQVELRASIASAGGRPVPLRWAARMNRARDIERRAQAALYEASDALSDHDLAAIKFVAPVIARCSCGKTYTAEQWAELPKVGVQEGDGLRLELRNCPCLSTISTECCSNCDADYFGCEGCDGPGADKADCGHSACSQYFIDTGHRACVADEQGKAEAYADSQADERWLESRR